ncbi:MAG: hypothetical protein AAFR04_04745 [Pseudomonadota bacterium]
MAVALKLRDETIGGAVVQELRLNFATHDVSLREIIAERVRMEVDEYQRRVDAAGQPFANTLVRPSDAEALLNKPKRQRRRIDVDKQIDVALKAFETNGFFVLAGGTQVEDLDARVSLLEPQEITFVKLTPLVGG